MNLPDMNILVVEDNPGDAFSIQEMLVKCKTPPAHLFVVAGIDAALSHLAQQSIDIVLLDLPLSDSDGLGTLDRIKIHWPGPVIVLTGDNNEVDLADAHRQSIQLLITDVVMPEMNGRELAELLRVRLPGLKHLFMSGYTAGVMAANGVLEEGTNFLQKPFSNSDLAEKVYAVLG